jgi:cytoskeletal protein CcmA (bactofilin family)
VNGDISTRSIVVMEGARINGAVHMTELALVVGTEESRESKEARAARRS